MAANLTDKGVYANASDGLTTLANKILQIETGNSTNHYNLKFNNNAYTADNNGNATLTLILQDCQDPISNVDILVSDGIDYYTATTNAQGIATCSVNGIGTYVASYLHLTATCQVISYLFYDDASADLTSTTFGSSYALRSGTSTVTWNSGGYYILTQTGSQRESMMQILPLNGISSDFTVEYDSYVEQVGGSSGLVIYNSATSWEKLTDDADSNKKYWYGYNDGSFHENAFYGNATTYQRWVHHKYTIQGTAFTMEVTDIDTGSIIVSHTETIHFTRNSNTIYGLDSEWQRNTKTRYKNIVAKSL